MKRQNVRAMAEAREAHKNHIMASRLCQTGDPFTSADAAKLIKKTTSCSSQYLLQLVKERRLECRKEAGTMKYWPAQKSLISVSWRHDESVYEDIQEAACAV